MRSKKFKFLKSIDQVVGGQFYIRVYVSEATQIPEIMVLKVNGKAGSYKFGSMNWTSCALRTQVLIRGKRVPDEISKKPNYHVSDIGISDSTKHYARLYPFSNRVFSHLVALKEQGTDAFLAGTHLSEPRSLSNCFY